MPTSQWQNILQQLHETHRGLVKCCQNAQMAVWWPGIGEKLNTLIDNCQVCCEKRLCQRSELLCPTQLPDCLWQKIGDFCSHGNKECLIVVDYYSQWLEKVPMVNTTVGAVIVKIVCNTQNSRYILISNKGPSFQSQDFCEFAAEFDFM